MSDRHSTASESIYLARSGEFYKIGRSGNVAHRLEVLDTGPCPVRLVHSFPSERAPRVERALHVRFAEKHVRGEWFRLGEEDIAAICSIATCDRARDLPPQLMPPQLARRDRVEPSTIRRQGGKMPGRKPVWPPRPHPHRQSGQERIRVNGKHIYLGPIGSEKAKAAYARLLAELAAGKPVGQKPGQGLTVADVIALWWESEAVRYDPAGREPEQFRRALAPLLRLYGPTPAAAFGANELEAVQRAMAAGSWMTDAERADLARRKKPHAWSRKQVNRHVGRIRTAWRWVERKGHVPRGNWAGLCALPGLRANDRTVRDTAPVKPAREADVEATVRELAEPVRTMLRLQAVTGMRSGEVRLIRPSEIDRAGAVWVYRPTRHKNSWRNQARAIPLGPRAQALLAPLLEGADPDLPVFRAKGRAACYTPSGYARAVARAAVRAGAPGLHPYQVRHLMKERVTREQGLDAARSVLGQKSVETTAKYAEGIDLETAAEIAARLG